MQVYQAKGVSDGIAVGTIHIFRKTKTQVSKETVTDTKREVQRYEVARNCAIEQLEVLKEKARKEVGDREAAIFEGHQMLLEDRGFQHSVTELIETEHVNVEYALQKTKEKYAGMFEQMPDAYMQERAADIRDISDRVLAVLNGPGEENHQLQGPSIILAWDLTPSETIALDKRQMAALVTVQGTANSHTAILARTLNIPALVRTNLTIESALQGKPAIVDGTEGLLYVEPGRAVIERLMKKREDKACEKEALQGIRGCETITSSGKKIRLYANAGNLQDVSSAVGQDAEGIGLFRSEWIYLEKDRMPTEEEQYVIYREALKRMDGRQVIIRTLDIGADKQCSYLQQEKEENPALGLRAIRLCLDQPMVFRTQLRALMRAAVWGNLAIMYPMITSVWEITVIKTMAEEVQQELEAEHIPYGHPSQGIMIETPAAVMMSPELARKVDFFSIGTNDLTQYTLAADRQNPKLEPYQDPHHPAVLRMIRMVTEAAHAEGIWAGVCGELAADPTITGELLDAGVDELSVVPGQILSLRKRIREAKLSG